MPPCGNNYTSLRCTSNDLGDIDKAIAHGSAAQEPNVRRCGGGRNDLRGDTCRGVLGSQSAATLSLEPLGPPRRHPTRDVHGWPTTVRNAAGDYSLDGDRCGGRGPEGAVLQPTDGCTTDTVPVTSTSASMPVPRKPSPMTVAPPVSVAGHDGIYRQITAHQEDWIGRHRGDTGRHQPRGGPRHQPGRPDRGPRHHRLDAYGAE